ncbi:hypothetical protein TNCV_1470841 [Trichonephila clavipes]|nr:hypothetical protein TNCV_1470841 [Trichonephila clavipes]
MPVVRRNLDNQTGDSTIFYISIPILMQSTLEGERASQLFSSSNSLSRGLAARRIFRILRSHKGISMPTPGFEPSPYGSAVKVKYHCTGWASPLIIILSSIQIFHKSFP